MPVGPGCRFVSARAAVSRAPGRLVGLFAPGRARGLFGGSV